MKFRALILALIFIGSNAFADSPLTSTPFAEAYKTETIILKAANSGGVLTMDLMEYLAEKNNPIAIKMAVINQLGWDFSGTSKATDFLNYLKSIGHCKSQNDLLKKGSKDDLLCMAYIKAMDNYFEVDVAIKFAEAAVKKNPKSYTFQIITALIKAQKAMATDWCSVYQLAHNVRTNTILERDMNDAAIKIIFDYMDLYKEECK